MLFTSIHVAIRFKVAYKHKYQKEYGQVMKNRTQNEIRKALNFAAMTKMQSIIRNVKAKFSYFIFKTFLVRNTCQRFTWFNDNLVKIQYWRRRVNE